MVLLCRKALVMPWIELMFVENGFALLRYFESWDALLSCVSDDPSSVAASRARFELRLILHRVFHVVEIYRPQAGNRREQQVQSPVSKIQQWVREPNCSIT